MLLVFGIFLLLAMLGVPLAVAMLLAGILFMAVTPGIGFVVIPQQMEAGLDSFPLLAVPFFLLAGSLMNEAGVTDRLVVVGRALVGHIRGGLAHALVVAGMILAGCSGSGTADAAALGSVMIPTMKKEGYDTPFAASVSACAGAIGPIIPPSIIMIIYGALGNVSVGALFLGGFLPGAFMGLFLMGTAYIIARRRGYGTTPMGSLRERAWAVGRSILDILFPIILVGGIVGGVFTPTEAGAVGVAYVLFIGVVVYRTLNGSRILRACRETILIFGGVMFIIAAASNLQYILSLVQAANQIGDYFAGISESPAVFLLLVNLLFLVLGCLLDAGPILIMMTPVLVPILPRFGIDPVHFGVMVAVNLAIGLLTPPVGLAMYVTCGIGQVSLERYLRACWPFILALLIVLVLTSALPSLVLWLPRAVIRG